MRLITKIVNQFLLYISLAALTVIFVFPFLWMVFASLKTNMQIFAIPPVILPKPAMWKNYILVWQNVPLARFYINSIFVSSSVAVAQVLTSAMAAYVFARLYFPRKNLIFLLYLGVMMIPTQVTVIPLFIIVRKLAMIDTFGALIIPFLAYPYGAFLLRQFFLTIPSDLEDAARIDGHRRIAILFRLVIPLSKPAMITLALLTFMVTWNSFFWPLVSTNTTEHYTVQVGLAMLKDQLHMRGDWSTLMAGTVLVTIPVLTFFIITQKHIIRGFSMSGLKY
ncbi:MAG: carbohydrate ABC transporter permease [Spirochaetales bacterium]|jgi:multiple sugar transport system permease protein|nr:carbohydrate ABC transporter permease [Spirochaetales bacterium]